MAQPNIQTLLIDALKTASKPRRTDPSSELNDPATSFYDTWFQDQGQSYFFLFKKNLATTNIQVPELISLLHAHILDKEGNPISNSVQFISAREFKDFFRQLFNNKIPDHENTLKNIAKTYDNIISRYAILNTYYGSCSIYLPPHLSVNLSRLCAESGYIHSCGPLVYVRNMNKASKENFETRIDKYLMANPPHPGKQNLFVTYSHEDFSNFDREYTRDLSNGLDDVKIYSRKAYIGDQSIIDYMREFRNKYSSLFLFPPPGDYRTARQHIRNQCPDAKFDTFWLISDSSIGESVNIKGRRRYYIVYHQYFYNDNPYHIFDEDKPAWFSHTTISHSLAAAMINITRPWNSPSPIQLHDPFGGSGTISMEALKFSQTGRPTSADKNPMASIVLKDNFDFFSLDEEAITQLAKNIDFIQRESAVRDTKIEGKLDKVRNFFKKVRQKVIEEKFLTEAQTKTIDEFDVLEKVIFYSLCRALIRHSVNINDDRTDLHNSFLFELGELSSRVNRYCEFKQRAWHVDPADKDLRLSVGEYSQYCYIDPADVQGDLIESYPIRVAEQDAANIPENSQDLIITDPPYGFNTREDDIELAALYRRFFTAAIRGLKSGGQLVVCCPEASYTGRRIPPFVQPGFVTQLVSAAAHDASKEAFVLAESLPSEIRQIRPPYYWEAATALRRCILHFHVRARGMQH